MSLLDIWESVGLLQNVHLLVSAWINWLHQLQKLCLVEHEEDKLDFQLVFGTALDFQFFLFLLIVVSHLVPLESPLVCSQVNQFLMVGLTNISFVWQIFLPWILQILFLRSTSKPEIFNFQFLCEKWLQFVQLIHIFSNSDNAIYIHNENDYLSITRVFEKHCMINLALETSLAFNSSCKLVKLCFRWLFQPIECSIQYADISSFIKFFKPQWQVYKNFFLQITIQKSLFYI